MNSNDTARAKELILAQREIRRLIEVIGSNQHDRTAATVESLVTAYTEINDTLPLELRDQADGSNSRNRLWALLAESQPTSLMRS